MPYEKRLRIYSVRMKVVPRLILTFVPAPGTGDDVARIERTFAAREIAEEKDG
jgi:hypothetical protein